MKRIILAMLLIAVSSFSITFEEATDIVMTEVLSGNAENARVSGLETKVNSGEVIHAWHDEVIVPFDSYYFLVDPTPTANWEHPCQWVFVDDNGNVSEYTMTTPPKDEVALKLVDITDPLVEGSITYDEIRERIKQEQIKRFGAESYDIDRSGLKGDRYVLLLSGGASTSSNYIRYWNDMAYIYRALINYYGYTKSEIVICMSDGDNPADDRRRWPYSGYDSSPLDLDGDGVGDYTKDALLTTVTAELQYLVDNVQSDDFVFVFMTDHGGGGGSGDDDVYLNLWNYEELDDDVFAGYIDDLPSTAIKVLTMEQCYSGGFIDDIEDNGTDNVIIATAASYYESSYAMAPYYLFNAYVFHWTGAVNFAEPDFEGYSSGAVDADTDSDTFCQMDEAHVYAVANDTASETPCYYDSSGIGDTVDLFGGGSPNQPPGDFDLVSPTDGAIVPTTVSLEWETSTDPDGDTVYYSVYYDTDADVTDGTVATSNITDVTYTFPAGVLSGGTQYYWRIEATDNSVEKWALSTWSFTTEGTAANGENPPIPVTFNLSSAMPNPSRGITRIEFALPKACDINLSIYDISGRKIDTLADGFFQVGYYDVELNNLSRGIYIYRIEAGDYVSTKKLVVNK